MRKVDMCNFERYLEGSALGGHGILSTLLGSLSRFLAEGVTSAKTTMENLGAHYGAH